MRRSFALRRDLNRPMQPRLSDLASQISKYRYGRIQAEVGLGA